MSQAFLLHEENQDEKIIDSGLKGNSESSEDKSHLVQLPRLKLQVSQSPTADKTLTNERILVIALPKIVIRKLTFVS